ncbi:MAG: AMP-binding protein [Sulfurimonas sp.]|nr:AMP-binding protein [Sulfurimonas sp.]
MKHPYKNLENFTLASLLDRSIKLYREKDAFGYVGEGAMSYAAFDLQIKNTVALLRKNGIKKGDKVLLLSENMPHWGVAYFATTYFGAVIVPVLPDFHTSDVHHILRHSEAKAVFVSDKHLATIEECENKAIDFVVNIESLQIIEELTKKHHKEQEPKEALQKPNEEDLAALIYTSGTTGHSKGVMLSHKNLTTNAVSSYSKVTITSEDVFLSILPLAHTLECTVGLIVPVLHGSSVYYVEKAPTPSVLLKAFEVVRPTMMLTVPLIIEKIYKNRILPKFHSSFIMRTLYGIAFFRKILNKIAGKKLIETFGGRIRFFGIGGAALSPHVEEFLIEAKFPYIIGYGLTETAPLLAGSVLGEKVKLRSTGTAFAEVIIKIKNKNPQTGEGEIIVQSPGLMMGYYKDEEKTKEVIKDGWFYTGDLGYMDKEGFLFISGRSKNVIIGPGGENIYPEQLESIINENEGVVDVLVLEQEGKIVARVHLDYELIDKMFHADKMPDAKVREDIAKHLEAMRLHINSQISSFSKISKFIEQIEPFVKTPTKKIKRYLYTE